MAKQDAIERLKERIDRIKQVKATARFGYTFTKWHQDTESLIKLIFPGERDRVHAFTSIKYEPDLTSGLNPVEDESLCDRSYVIGLERAEAILQSFIDEIKENPISRPFSASPDPRLVFVVHGRDPNLRRSFFVFLRALGLEPLEWSKAVRLTGKGSPYIGEILDTAFSTAQAVAVMLTPDDQVRLLPELCSPSDPPEEYEYRLQGRPNVLFEAGMAFGRYPERTILVEIGDVKKFSDVAGRHAVRLTKAYAYGAYGHMGSGFG